MTQTLVRPEVLGPVPEPTPGGAGLGARLNWLRAGVMGANDGIVSTAALVVGVAGAAVSDGALLVAGVSASTAGALSMAVGEYVSVSSQRDAVIAHEALVPGIDPDELTNPWHAAWASMIAFAAGALIPLLAILLAPRDLAVPLTTGAVLLALAATGCISARLGRARHLPAMVRTVGGGLLAMTVTYGIGLLVGTWV
jgi:VIT1/CCC1 family predicted Fe2+/Mn2+ transporter